jgi:hypothetical protein
VRSYGRTNPNEDWATVWEYYFDGYQNGWPTSPNLLAKLGDVAMLFGRLSNVV